MDCSLQVLSQALTVRNLALWLTLIKQSVYLEGQDRIRPAVYFDLLPIAGALMKLSRCFRSCSGRVGGTVGLHGFLLGYLIFVGHGQRCACMCKCLCACMCMCVCACVSACVRECMCVCVCVCLQTCKTAAEIIPGFSRDTSPHVSHRRR